MKKVWQTIKDIFALIGVALLGILSLLLFQKMRKRGNKNEPIYTGDPIDALDNADDVRAIINDPDAGNADPDPAAPPAENGNPSIWGKGTGLFKRWLEGNKQDRLDRPGKGG